MPNPENPKILYILSQLGQGGAQQQLYYLLKTLKPPATILSLAPGGYWLKPYQDLGYKVIELPRTGSYDISRLRGVMRAIRGEQPDIVHLWLDGIPGAYGRIATRLLGFRPTVVGLRSYPGRDPAWYKRIRRSILTRHISMFVANSLQAQQYMVRMEGVPASRSRFIPNGIEVDQFRPRPPGEPRPILPDGWDDKIIVGTVGSLNPHKGPDIFLKVAASVIARTPNVRFIHAGDGSMRDAVRDISRELGIESFVHYLGSRSDIPDVLRAMDIFILTSKFEGTPNVVMEAMATALPCVVTDVGDCKTLLTHGESGFVSPIGDIDCLTDDVLKLASDSQLRAQMGQAGYETIQAYDVPEMAEQYRLLYQEVLNAERQ